MASVEVPHSIYTRFLDENYSASGENMCAKCCIMKDHLELFINEVKSSQSIMQILQEEIKSTSICPKNQDNLTTGAKYKSHDESHPTSDKNSAWKEIRRTRTTATKQKRYNHTEQRATDTFPLSSNRHNPLCNVSEVDNTPESTRISRMIESKQIRKHKLDRKKKEWLGKNNKVIIYGG